MITEPRELALFDDPRWIHGLHLFNSHQWYPAHDALEEIWHETYGSLRSLLQGIIQVSVAEYHLENGNYRGATLLMAEGLNHLKSFSYPLHELNLDCLVEIVSRRLFALQSEMVLVDLPYPSLQQTQQPHAK